MVLSNLPGCDFSKVCSTRGEFSGNSSSVVILTIKALMYCLQHHSPMTISLSSARTVGVLKATQPCPLEALLTLSHINDLNLKSKYRFKTDEVLRRKCEQALITSGGRPRESWTLLERLKLHHLQNRSDLGEYFSKLGNSENALLDLPRVEVDRLFSASNTKSIGQQSVYLTPISLRP